MRDPNKPKKKISVPMILFCILMVVTLLLCGTAFAIWNMGRSSLQQEVVAPVLPPKPPAPAEETEEEAEAEPEPEPELLDEFTLEHDGKYYRYNEGMCNILLLGIDSDYKPYYPMTPGSKIQTDVLVLAALDLKNKDLTLISLNRDTMAQIEVINPAGESLGYSRSQLALAFSYGDGLNRSCELARNAVSNLFYGLQIHGYGGFYLGGVGALTDALGGVTVTIPENDVDFTQTSWDMYPGNTLTLQGWQARTFIQSRKQTEDGNALRMARQKQFMLSMINQAVGMIKDNPAKALELYNTLSGFIITDLSVSQISYMATQAVNMDFTGDIRSVEGDLVLGAQQHMELNVNEEALYDLMLDVFYEEVELDD